MTWSRPGNASSGVGMTSFFGENIHMAASV
jgi:hypothetical protein